jgi:DNA-binding NtrC family response regulator
MEARVVVVTTSIPVRDAVERVLARAKISVRHELSAQAGSVSAKVADSVVICTVDVDWRLVLSSLSADGEIGPPVILLMPAADARLWAEALLAGVFDAIAMTGGPDELLDAVAKAQSRCERARLVRQALKQNAIMHRVA